MIVVSDGSAPIRSYQRIFIPDRRIYQIDGRQLPVPGGIPLRWLAWAFASVLVILALSGRSLLLSGLLAVVAAFAGSLRSWRTAVAAGCIAIVAAQAAGVMLGWLAFPLRLVVLPVAVATAASQMGVDGRSPHRYLFSYLCWRLRAEVRSLERPLQTDKDGHRVWVPGVWIAPDADCAVIARGRVCGPARLDFGRQVVLTRRRGRHVVRAAGCHRARPGDVLARSVELADGQVLEVRP